MPEYDALYRGRTYLPKERDQAVQDIVRERRAACRCLARFAARQIRCCFEDGKTAILLTTC